MADDVTKNNIVCDIIESSGHVRQCLTVSCYSENGRVLIAVPTADIIISFENSNAKMTSRALNDLSQKGG